MNKLLILRNIRVENANAIAGLTYGFPSITHFLGFTHALSRRTSRKFDISLSGCMVVAHDHHIKMQQPKNWGDRVFALTRNPLTKGGKTAAFIEEGKMHMEVSLLIDISGYLSDDDFDELQDFIEQHLATFRLAGGTIIRYEKVSIADYPDSDRATRKLLYSLLPGFVLMDKTGLLRQHAETRQLDILDAWLDFIAIKYKAEPKPDEAITEKTKADWQYVDKPYPGYLVPIMTGYKGISPLYSPGTVKNTRDPDVPFRFVEAVYGIGEWKSPHRLTDIAACLWHYQHQDDLYLCRQPTVN